MTIERIS